MQAVKELALILMNPLHLDVEERVGVDLDLVLSLKVCGELQLVFLRQGGGAELSCRPQPVLQMYFLAWRRRLEGSQQPAA